MKRQRFKRFKKHKDLLKQWFKNLNTTKIQKRKQRRKSVEEFQKELKKKNFLEWAKRKLRG